MNSCTACALLTEPIPGPAQSLYPASSCDLFLGLQAAGWKTEKHHLEVNEWRATWPLSPEKKVS